MGRALTDVLDVQLALSCPATIKAFHELLKEKK